jgi:hypothetical protein
MTASDQPAAARRPDQPTLLWARVVQARSLVTSQRSLPECRTSADARAELLSALEAYAVSLTNHGRPIPYALRDELRLKRLTRNK